MKPTLSPAHWPFEQAHVLLVIKQREHAVEQERLKTSTSLRDVDFQNSDDDETAYAPSEDSKDDGGDDRVSEDEDESESDGETVETEPIDVDVDIENHEVLDLARELEENPWPSSPTASEKDRAEQQKFEQELALLDAAEKEAASSYSPDEIVALITEFYELLVKIGHWSEGWIQKAPYTNPAVNVDLAQTLGFDPAVVDLMQKLPYVRDQANEHLSQIIPDSFFMDYTEDRYLKGAKKHVGYDRYGAPIDSWILPLVGPSNRDGWSVVLDTRLGVIRAYTPMNGPPKASIEYRRHGQEGENEDGPLQYHRAPLVPTANYLRTLIECYMSLNRVPMMDAYHSNLDWRKDPPSEDLKWYYENIEDEQLSILALYKECGWPDQWDRATFVEKWNLLNKQLAKRKRERMIRDGALQ